MAEPHHVPGAFFEITGTREELFRIIEGIEKNDGRHTASDSMTLDLWQEMLDAWFLIRDAKVQADERAKRPSREQIRAVLHQHSQVLDVPDYGDCLVTNDEDGIIDDVLALESGEGVDLEVRLAGSYIAGVQASTYAAQKRLDSAVALAEEQAKEGGRARVITLCGSSRFKDAFHAENQRLTMEGNVVISLGLFGHVDLPDRDWTTDATDLKRMLDRLHFQKIDLADSVHVVAPGGYIGESTAREIAYAESLGKAVTYSEPGATTEASHEGQ